jgi:hypothetical protein
MARAKKRTPRVQEVRPCVEGVAKNLVDKLYGSDGPGWGTKLTESEDLLLELRQILTQLLALAERWVRTDGLPLDIRSSVFDICLAGKPARTGITS